MPNEDTLDIGGAAGDFIPLAEHYTGDTTQAQGFGEYLGVILNAIMVIAALLVLLNLIWGAFEWISSGGDKGKVEKGRNRITQSIIGVIVLAASLVLFTLLQNFLGISVLNFESNSPDPRFGRATNPNRPTGGDGRLLPVGGTSNQKPDGNKSP